VARRREQHDEERKRVAGTRKRQGELVQGVFEALMPERDGLAKQQVHELVEQSHPPTRFESECYPKRPGVRRYERTIDFVTIGPSVVGWLK
jgi:hypothetical protein